MIELPKDVFCSWHGESWKSLINPTGVCNAFTHGAGVDDNEKAWWEEKGYHREPLYTADQLRTYGDQRAAEAREQMREECIAAAMAEHENPNNLELIQIGALQAGRAIRKLP